MTQIKKEIAVEIVFPIVVGWWLYVIVNDGYLNHLVLIISVG